MRNTKTFEKIMKETEMVDMRKEKIGKTKDYILGKEFSYNLYGDGRVGMPHTLVVGCEQSDTTYRYLVPNLMQVDSDNSFVIVDFGDDLVKTLGAFYQNHGYKVKVLNLEDMAHSNRYNPFVYARHDSDICMIAQNILDNTQLCEGEVNEEEEKRKYSLLALILSYMRNCVPKEKQTFATMLELLEMTKKNPDELYRLFEEQEKDPAAYYCSSYEYIKKQLNGKEKEVAEACLEQFALMREEPFQKLTESDNLNLYKVGDEKTALFVVMPPADRSYYFLGCVFVTQLLDGLLCHIEEDLEYKNLPHDVRIFLNNFADMGKVCNFPVNLMGIGKYNVNVTLVLQNLITLARRYPDDEMRSYFDNIVYFDSRNQFTLETVAGWLDNVFTPEQLAYEKPANTCVVLVHGKPSMLCSTYDIRNHPYYKELADAEDMFQYEEMEKYMIE